MDELRALLAAIHAASDNDVPRLVFADWLEEHGYPERAEFIRVQCDLAAMVNAGYDGTDQWDDQFGRLRTREQQLWRDYRDQWFGPVAEMSGCLPRPEDVQRGFADPPSVSWAAWARHGDGLTGAFPVPAVILRQSPQVEIKGPASTTTERGTVGESTFRLDGDTRSFHLTQVVSGALAEELLAATMIRLRWPEVNFVLPDLSSMTAREMNTRVARELEHIPKQPGEHQAELRMVYNAARRSSLGRKRTENQSAVDVLRYCVASVRQRHPGAALNYDRSFFGE